jgi:hypothetical protein
MAFFRFCLGFTLIIDACYRLPDLVNLYSDLGLMTRDEVRIYAPEFSFSLLQLSGSSLWAGIILFLQAISGFMIMIGRHTRLFQVLAFICFVSVFNRCVVVNNGGDIILKIFLFYSFFLPLAQSSSLDASLAEECRKYSPYRSCWVMVFFIQTAIIYLATFLFKTDGIWRSDFTALYFTLRLPYFATPFGIWIRHFPELLKFLTIYVITLEWAGPALLFFCWFFKQHWWIARFGLVILFVSFHLGIWLTMWLGIFPLVSMLIWTIFIPPQVWDYFEGLFEKKGFHLLKIEYLSGNVKSQNLARGVKSLFLLSRVETMPANEGNFRFFRISYADGMLNDEEALAIIFRNSPLFFWLSPVLGFRLLARSFIALLNALLSFTIPLPRLSFSWTRKVSEAFGVFIIVLVLLWNLASLEVIPVFPSLKKAVYFLQLRQRWLMFGPRPMIADVWQENHAKLKDGQWVDVYHPHGTGKYSRERAFFGHVTNERWSHFFMDLIAFDEYKSFYSQYLCRRWNLRGERSGYKSEMDFIEMSILYHENFLHEKNGPTQLHYSKSFKCGESFISRSSWSRQKSL